MRKKLILMIIFAGISAGARCAQAQNPPPPPADIKALVQEVADKAVKEVEQTDVFFRFHMRKETLTYKLDREMVETKEGFVARTLKWQDRELTPEERTNDDNKLDRLIMDKDERDRIFKRQQEESHRILRLVKALPVAALYEFDGYESIGKSVCYKLKLKPNPKYDPDSREVMVYKTTEGHLWIDAYAHTIVKLEGTLTDDINFGWGILGHIEKGGKIELEQNEISPGHWRITKLIVEARGRMLLFKSIDVWQHQYTSDYKLLTKEPTLQEGINMLRNGNSIGTTH